MPVKCVCGFIYRDDCTYQKVRELLKRKLGEIDYESQVFSFTFTHYYDSEMGTPLYRRFVSFLKLIDPARLVDTKLRCIKIEKKFSDCGKRTINIDPGYLNEAKFVLTTTKDFAHRIYVGKGIFEEVTLLYKDKAFHDLATTYPDYRSPEYKEIMLALRRIYRNQIKKFTA